MQTLPDIQNQALKLDRKDRLALLLGLLESVEPEASENNNDSMDNWINEAEFRYQVWKKGGMNTISEEEAFKRLNKKD